jgi:hypothetical protein
LTPFKGAKSKAAGFAGADLQSVPIRTHRWSGIAIRAFQKKQAANSYRSFLAPIANRRQQRGKVKPRWCGFVIRAFQIKQDANSYRSFLAPIANRRQQRAFNKTRWRGFAIRANTHLTLLFFLFIYHFFFCILVI